jgi:chromatin remodeling complex protein RSC6
METIIQELQTRLSTLETKHQRLEKMFRKMKKDMIPEDQRVPRKPSGFAKATYMSPTLCDFLGVAHGTEMARTEVTKHVLAYVKEQNLQNPENKRIINMNDKLQKLLNPEKDEVVTYFSIQRLMKVHYVKPTPVEPAPTEPAPVVVADKKKTTSKNSKKK